MRWTLRDGGAMTVGLRVLVLPVKFLIAAFMLLAKARYGRFSRFFMLFVAIWFSVLPTVQVLAATGDAQASFIAQQTGPGEFSVIKDGPNGFQIVEFFNNGANPNTATPISTIESGTTNVGGGGGGNTGGSTNPDYVGDAVDQTVETAIPGAKDGTVVGGGGIFIPPIPSVVLRGDPNGPGTPFPGAGDPVPGGGNNPDPDPGNDPPVGDPVDPPVDNDACKKCKAKLAALLAQRAALVAQISALTAKIADVANDPSIPDVEALAAANVSPEESALIAQQSALHQSYDALVALTHQLESQIASNESRQNESANPEEFNSTVAEVTLATGAASATASLFGLIFAALATGAAATVGATVVIVTFPIAVVAGGIGIVLVQNIQGRREEKEGQERSLRSQLNTAQKEINRLGGILASDITPRLRDIQNAREDRAEKERERQIGQLKTKLQKQLDGLETKLRILDNAILNQRNRCRAICAAGGQANLNVQQVVAFAAGPASTTRTNFGAKTPRQSTIPVTIKGNRLVGKFDLRQMRKTLRIEAAAAAGQRSDGGPLVELPGIFGDERFNIWVSPNVSIQDNTRSGPNQDGTTVSISGGASWLVQQGLNIGLVARYANTNLKGSGAKTTSDTWSAGAFIQALIAEQVNLTVAGVYSHSDIDSRFTTAGVTARGDANADAFSTQAKLSRSFKMGDFTITPALSASYVHINRKAFTLSDGTFVPGGKSNQLTFSGGPSISRTFVMPESEIEITPSLGVNFFVNASRAKSFLDANFVRRKSGNYGVSVSGGLGFKTPSGINWAINGGFSGSEGGQRSYTIGGNLTVPLN